MIEWIVIGYSAHAYFGTNTSIGIYLQNQTGPKSGPRPLDPPIDAEFHAGSHGSNQNAQKYHQKYRIKKSIDLRRHQNMQMQSTVATELKVIVFFPGVLALCFLCNFTQ